MTDPYQVIHDDVALSWDDVNAIAANLDAAGFMIVSRDRLDALEAVAQEARPLVAIDPEADEVPDEDWGGEYLALRAALEALDA